VTRLPWRGIVAVVLLMQPVFGVAANTPGIETTYAQHTHAVALARAGQYDAGRAILRRLLRDFPHDYPLNRDFILITAWQGDCPEVIRRFDAMRDRPSAETAAAAGLDAVTIEQLQRTPRLVLAFDAQQQLLPLEVGERGNIPWQ
jgi:predicted Zn-dependent protease